MAVLDKVRGLTACVMVDGKPLEEYEDDEDEEERAEDSNAAQYRASRTITKYVESASNKEYAIQINLGRMYHFDSPTLHVDVKIDGKVMARQLISKEFHKMRKNLLDPSETLVEGVYTKPVGSEGRSLLKKFKFSKITLCKVHSTKEANL